MSKDDLRYVLEEALVFAIIVGAVLTDAAVHRIKHGQVVRWGDILHVTPETALRALAAVGTWGTLHQVWKKIKNRPPLVKRLLLAATVGRGFRGEADGGY